MRILPALLATTLASAALLAGPAQASDDDDNFQGVCGDGYTHTDTTKIGGLGGHERLGWIVQATNPTTHDACVFVHLKKEQGTTGDLSITYKSAAKTTTQGGWDNTTIETAAVDLNKGNFTSAPTHFAYTAVDRVSADVKIDGKAFQGKQHSEKHVKKVKVSDLDKKAAKKRYEHEVEKANREYSKSHSKHERTVATKAAKKKYEKACADKTVTTVVVVPDRTPFTSVTNLSFLLNDTADEDDARDGATDRR